MNQLVSNNKSTPLQKELMGTLQITFIHDEPDFLREIPAVPG